MRQLPHNCQPIVDDLYVLFTTSPGDVPGTYVSRSSVVKIKFLRLRFELIIALQSVAKADYVILLVSRAARNRRSST